MLSDEQQKARITPVVLVDLLSNKNMRKTSDCPNSDQHNSSYKKRGTKLLNVSLQYKMKDPEASCVFSV